MRKQLMNYSKAGVDISRLNKRLRKLVHIRHLLTQKKVMDSLSISKCSYRIAVGRIYKNQYLKHRCNLRGNRRLTFRPLIDKTLDAKAEDSQ